MEKPQSTPEGVVNALEIVQSPEFVVAVDAATIFRSQKECCAYVLKIARLKQ